MKRVSNYIMVILLVLATTNQMFAQHFTTIWSGYPYQPMSILVQEAHINGVHLIAGDEIAVFDIGDNNTLICVGTVVLADTISPANPAIITAGSDDGTTGEIDGFTSGNPLIFKMWRSTDMTEVEVTHPTYDGTFSTVFTTFGTALITELEGFLPVVTTLDSLETCQGSITMPIMAQDIYLINQFLYTIQYESDQLTYTGVTLLEPQLDAGNLQVTNNAGIIEVEWNTSTPMTVFSDTLMELIFTVAPVFEPTVEEVVWLEESCYYINLHSDTLSSTFENGLLSINPIASDAGLIYGAENLCGGALGASYETDSIDHAASYLWELTPSTAGIIQGSGTSITIDFAISFAGEAILSVAGSNICGEGDPSTLSIEVHPFPSSNAGPDDWICEENSYLLSGTATYQASQFWTTFGDGVFDDSTSLAAVYTPGVMDRTTGYVSLQLTATPQAPCENPAVDEMILQIDTYPDQPSQPMGPLVVYLENTTISEYMTNRVDNTDNYRWNVEPMEAGVISGSDTIGIMQWNPGFTGLAAFIFVEAISACGENSSDTTVVDLFPVGLVKNDMHHPEITIAPNPASGFIRLHFENIAEEFDFSIIDFLGQSKLYNSGALPKDENMILVENIPIEPGIYILSMTIGNKVINRKFVIY